MALLHTYVFRKWREVIVRLAILQFLVHKFEDNHDDQVLNCVDIQYNWNKYAITISYLGTHSLTFCSLLSYMGNDGKKSVNLSSNVWVSMVEVKLPFK